MDLVLQPGGVEGVVVRRPGARHRRRLSHRQWKVVCAGQPEPVGVGDVRHGLGVAGGVLVGVGADDVAVLVSRLLLGGVGVGVAVGDSAVFVLSMELAGSHVGNRCGSRSRRGVSRFSISSRCGSGVSGFSISSRCRGGVSRCGVGSGSRSGVVSVVWDGGECGGPAQVDGGGGGGGGGAQAGRVGEVGAGEVVAAVGRCCHQGHGQDKSLEAEISMMRTMIKFFSF